MTKQSLAAVKAHFSQVIDEVSGSHERVTITKNGSPVAVLLAVEDYESLVETLEILSDPTRGLLVNAKRPIPRHLLDP